mmetsp:Transcript_25414/g.22567  ORF Transcript_25414/g.22567 Transcript_25414/m.22567 type:complete len:104 (-) Transcript_25414:1345-1656(-)
MSERNVELKNQVKNWDLKRNQNIKDLELLKKENQEYKILNSQRDALLRRLGDFTAIIDENTQLKNELIYINGKNSELMEEIENWKSVGSRIKKRILHSIPRSS